MIILPLWMLYIHQIIHHDMNNNLLLYLQCYSVHMYIHKLISRLVINRDQKNWIQCRLKISASVNKELMPPKKKSSQLTRVASVFDPRPPSFRSHVPEASEQLRCCLMALNLPCAFLHILVPDVGVINHDHSYSLDPALLEEERTISTTPVTSRNVSTEYTTRILDDATVATFKDTRCQS